MDSPVAPPAYSPSKTDAGEIIANYKAIGGDEYTPPSGYMDNNGNVWDKIPQLTEDGYTTPNLLVDSSVTNDPFLKATGLDPFQAKDIYALKETDPHGYYSQIGNALENKIYGTLFDNSDSSTYRNALEQLKTLDPQTYYQNKIKFESQAAGWDAAQNEAGRSAGHQNAVQTLAPDAIKAGLTPQQINDLYNQSASQAGRENQQYISNRKDTFWHDNLIGALKVGSLALGAYGLDSALTAGMTGMVDSAGNIIGGGAEGAAYGANTAATQALPYTEAYDIANLTSQGLSPEQIAQITSNNFSVAPEITGAAANASTSTAEDGLYKQFLDAFQNPDVSNLPTYESTAGIPSSDVPADLVPKESAYDPMQASQEGYDLPKYDPMQASQEGFEYTPKYDPMQASQEGYTLPDKVAKEPLSIFDKITSAPSRAYDYLANTPVSEIGSDLYNSIAANPLSYTGGALGIAGLAGVGPLAGIGKAIGTAQMPSGITSGTTTGAKEPTAANYKYGSAGNIDKNYLLRNRLNAANIYSNASGYRPVVRMAGGGEVKHFGLGGISDSLTKVFQPIEKSFVQPIGQAAPFLRDVLPYAGMIAAPFIASPMAAAGVGALASGMGKGGFNMKRALMGGISAYGMSNLGAGLESAGSTTPAADIAGSMPDTANNFFRSPEVMAKGAENLMAGGNSYDVAAKNFASKAGIPSAGMAIMGQAGVSAVDEGIKQQAAADQALAQSEAAQGEMNTRNQSARDRAFAAIHAHPYQYAMGGMIPNPPDDQTGMANQTPMQNFEHGGILGYAMGGYAMGGEPRFLSGGGDGMSDSIQANIEGTQEARLADGEFVVPADVVSGLGNGSSKAGAKQLYSMMDRVRQARTGTKKQGKQINPHKLMAV